MDYGRTIFVEDFYVFEKGIAIWDDFKAPGDLQEITTHIKEYGPFINKEQAEKEKEKIISSRKKEINEARGKVKDEFKISGQKLYHHALRQHFPPTDFRLSYSIDSKFNEASPEIVRALTS